MAEATEVQYDQHGRSVVRVSDPLLAYEIAQELHDHKEATEYWVKAADQARLKAARLNDELLSDSKAHIDNVELAHDLALEINGWRSKFELAVNSHRSARAQADSFGEEARKIRRELELFKKQVRDVAITVRDENDWCIEGLNGVLEELGLPEYNPKKYVEFKIRLLVEGHDDDDDARTAAEDFIANIGYDDDITVEEVDHRRTWDADES